MNNNNYLYSSNIKIDDIFSNNITTPLYYTNYKNLDMNTKQYLSSKRNYNFHIPNILNLYNLSSNYNNLNNYYKNNTDNVGIYPFTSDGINTTHILYQKENILHDAKDRVFSSCINTNNINGNIGCSVISNKLNEEYFIKNQNYHKNIINYLNKDIELIDTYYYN